MAMPRNKTFSAMEGLQDTSAKLRKAASPASLLMDRLIWLQPLPQDNVAPNSSIVDTWQSTTEPNKHEQTIQCIKRTLIFGNKLTDGLAVTVKLVERPLEASPEARRHTRQEALVFIPKPFRAAHYDDSKSGVPAIENAEWAHDLVDGVQSGSLRLVVPEQNDVDLIKSSLAIDS